MIRSLYNGVSGIKTQSYGIDVTANNISNINNVGFKSSRAEFKNIFYQTCIESGYFSGANQIGLGTTMQTTSLQMKQGSLINTERNLDLAIAGNGYFGVKGADGNIYYTRDGAFNVDKEGNLVTKNGELVMGTMAEFTKATLSQRAKDKIGEKYLNTKKISDIEAYTASPKKTLKLGLETAQKPIKLPKYMYMPPIPTSYVNFKGTLDIRSTFKDSNISLKTTSEQKLNGDGTINLSGKIDDKRLKAGDNIQITIKDKNANSQTISTTIKDDGSWSLKNIKLNKALEKTDKFNISANAIIRKEVPSSAKFATDVVSPSGAKNRLEVELTKKLPSPKEGSIWQAKATLLSPNNKVISSSEGELKFDSKGILTSSKLGSLDNDGSKLAVNLGAPRDSNVANMLFAGMVTREEKSKVTDIQKDGSQEGFFTQYSVGDNGEVYANFDNSTRVEVAKIPIFHFQNEQGLNKISGTMFAQSENSGSPFFYKDARGNLVYGAQIKSSFLEQSNVDLGEQLTELIVLQKGFDASSKSITTSNEMLKTAIGLKR